MLASAQPQTAWSTAALLGLGDLATRRKQLGAEAITALIETANQTAKPQDAAFYGLSRIDAGEQARRVVDAARVALGRPGDSRILAIRALGRAGKDTPRDVAPDLQRVVVDAKGYGHGERAEAARALAGLADAGQIAIANAIADLTPDAKDPIAIADLAGPSFHVLYTLLGSLGPEPPKKAEPALGVLANLTPPTQPKPGFARRIAELRCSAALALARGAHDAEILKKCADESSEPSQRARLASLIRRPITRERLNVLRAFAKSDHLRIREAVIEALGAHPEVGDAGPALLADALSSKHAGLVATAAEMLNAHPERALVLAESEKRAALDPRSPPPTASPAQELAPIIAKALSAAIGSKWPDDRFETRIAIVEAAVSVHHPQAKDVATALCKDKNPVMHERALNALRTLGAPTTACDTPDPPLKLAAEIGQTLAKPTKVVLTADSGELAMTLEPELSPITATRLSSLVKTGFFKGIVVHRVVPGFVVQLGDPEGDGYGGSGTSLRCETSPVPFRLHDVGMALAGRDTGSSQFFVTLSRTPHLDGEYTRVGHADGDWESVAQGDVINDAKLVE
jgi:cyclophilin family peptidyl-prolyl cis-trans isomerase